MTNAEKFKDLFGICATELWAMPEAKFLEWLNAKTEPQLEVKGSKRLLKGKDEPQTERSK